ncbi:YhgE/Pip domain-containing protein [Amnibacterium kyonggiense]|uniref:Putative membrane protein n=1 Tax=Amnibacterium kyonggiense TaxID=595671 RepID=A0A4R7FQ79_9MICO|nr:YhgE/Pip domain-containing protein [Amnibacterium kyonggiense]TDS79930.1 putative membrane protein [Amnibacterium kyonggiense]
MTILTLLRTELRRLTSTKLGVLAFVALMTVPLLYGGMYLWGNLDPYGKFANVPAGIVVADDGSTSGGTTVNRGRQAADDLVEDGSFDWHVLSADEARRELANGGVDFVVTFPRDFSRDIASAGTTDPTKAQLRLTTNDANSYLSSTIAKQVTTEVRDRIASQVGTTAAKRFLGSLSTVRGKLTDAADGASDLASGAGTAQSGAQRLADGTATLASGARSAASGAASAASGADRLASGASSAASGAADLASGAKRTASGASSLASGLDRLSSGASALPSGARSLASGASQVASGNAALASALRQAAGSTATGEALARQLAADGLTPAQIQQALAVLQPGQQALTRAASSADSLAQGASSLSSGATRLSSGASQVASAAAQAASGAGRVASGSRAVASGAASLASGTRSVASGASSLASGTDSLASGTQQLASGAASAASGSSALANGTARLSSGAASLRDGLAKGADAIPATTAQQRTAQAAALGDPVGVRTKDTASAGTYGAGLAPLFLSLSAWIGAYALFLILRPLSRRALTAVEQPIRVALAGWLTPALLGAAQMVALFLIATGPLGIHVVHPAATIGVLLLTAATFAAILLLLNAALGSVGQFLGLILMLVQLVTAGGTFPWQTLPGPLAAIHHALPMAYAVDALRQVMYGGDLSLAWGDAGVLAIWLVAAMALTSAVAARMTRHRTLRDLQPSLIGG